MRNILPTTEYDETLSKIEKGLKMNIDARTTTASSFGRPYTTGAAVANAIDTLDVGQRIDVDALIDPKGVSMAKLRLDVLVNKFANGRRFTVRKGMGAGLATIIRLA